ncbi:MAG: MBL fold metallo-hydrolase [Bdellovibrionota bacterium]
MIAPHVFAFYDEATATLSYVVYDPATLDAVVIDPVLDYDMASSEIWFESLNKLEAFVTKHTLKLHYCLETHAHADHLSGAQELKKRFPNLKLAIGERITEVQNVFKKIYNLPENFIPDGSQFDVLLRDQQSLCAGSLEIEVLFTPGHTPACVSYVIGDAVFTGDAIFMPDTGTGRCDFPKGSSATLWDSITTRLYKLPDTTRVFVGHDYKAAGLRNAEWETSIGAQKSANIHLSGTTPRHDYIQMRDRRDATLGAPRLLLPSLQVNIDAGHLPRPEDNGMRYIKVPLKNRP